MKKMKKILSALLVLIMVLSCFTVIAGAAEEPEKIVYISDNGSDDKDGLTADTAIQTYARAQEILGDKGGVIMITDIYTYPGTATYYMPYVKGASYTFRGMKADGSSVFAHARKNIAMTNPLTFDNLTYHLSASTWSGLYGFFNRIEFTETVKMRPYNDVDERVNYLFVYGGSDSKAGTKDQNSNLVLNGGTFGYIVGGCKNSEMIGKINITVGGTARIVQRVYCGGESGLNTCAGDVNLTVNGGTIGDFIYLGGVGDDSYVDGNVKVTLNGGENKGILCRGSGKGLVTGSITIDVTNYAPAQEAGWAEANVKDATDKTTIVGIKSAETEAPTEEPTQAPTEEPTQAPTQAPTEEPTQAPTEESTKAPAGEASGTTETPAAKKGCGSAISVACVGMIMAIAFGTAMAVRKKED